MSALHALPRRGGMEVADIYVRYSTNTYVTTAVQGQRASSAMSAEAAARRLGEKLFGERLLQVECMGRAEHSGIEHWQARALPQGRGAA